jgi:hypothetical protein
MKVQTGLKSGRTVVRRLPEEVPDSYGKKAQKAWVNPNAWYTCDHCKGKVDRYGDLNNATCNTCW